MSHVVSWREREGGVAGRSDLSLGAKAPRAGHDRCHAGRALHGAARARPARHGLRSDRCGRPPGRCGSASRAGWPSACVQYDHDQRERQWHDECLEAVTDGPVDTTASTCTRPSRRASNNADLTVQPAEIVSWWPVSGLSGSVNGRGLDATVRRRPAPQERCRHAARRHRHRLWQPAVGLEGLPLPTTTTACRSSSSGIRRAPPC